MNFNLNIHRVKSIRLSAIRPSKTNDMVSASRDLVIETDEGNFELSLFSVYVSEDDDQQLLEVKV
ncbi:MAG: hypothetical protein ACO2Z7_06475 [Burkholderiaceae bacterium]